MNLLLLVDAGSSNHSGVQPNKRRNETTADSGAAPKPRQSKLAKEHGITAQEEAEIKEAFALFSEPMDGEKEGVIPTDDVKRALMYVYNSHQKLGARIPCFPTYPFI